MSIKNMKSFYVVSYIREYVVYDCLKILVGLISEKRSFKEAWITFLICTVLWTYLKGQFTQKWLFCLHYWLSCHSTPVWLFWQFWWPLTSVVWTKKNQKKKMPKHNLYSIEEGQPYMCDTIWRWVNYDRTMPLRIPQLRSRWTHIQFDFQILSL